MRFAKLFRLAAPSALVAGAGVAVAVPPTHPDPHLRIAKASPLVHVNSRHGRAVLDASNLAPGDRRGAEVTLTNAGGDARLMLLASSPPGPLARRLELTVREGPHSFDRAPLADIKTCQSLGSFPAGSQRTIAFEIAFPASESDNVLAHTETGVDLEWVAASSDSCPVHEEAPAHVTSPPAPVEGRGHELTVSGMKLRIEPGPYRFARRSGTARVSVRCLAADTAVCAGTLALERRRSGQGRGIAMASGRIRVPVGRKRTITLRLNRRARKRVTSTGRVPVRAYVIARDARGRRHQAAYLDRLIYGRSSKRRSK